MVTLAIYLQSVFGKCNEPFGTCFTFFPLCPLLPIHNTASKGDRLDYFLCVVPLNANTKTSAPLMTLTYPHHFPPFLNIMPHTHNQIMSHVLSFSTFLFQTSHAHPRKHNQTGIRQGCIIFMIMMVTETTKLIHM